MKIEPKGRLMFDEVIEKKVNMKMVKAMKLVF